jgi:hypothetical protein
MKKKMGSFGSLLRAFGAVTGLQKKRTAQTGEKI